MNRNESFRIPSHNYHIHTFCPAESIQINRKQKFISHSLFLRFCAEFFSPLRAPQNFCASPLCHCYHLSSSDYSVFSSSSACNITLYLGRDFYSIPGAIALSELVHSVFTSAREGTNANGNLDFVCHFGKLLSKILAGKISKVVRKCSSYCCTLIPLIPLITNTLLHLTYGLLHTQYTINYDIFQ